MLYFPMWKAEGNITSQGFPGNLGTNFLVYFPKSNEITVMLHFTRENARKIYPKLGVRDITGISVYCNISHGDVISRYQH